ncbi:aldehyde ferredoxin oxidoreductase family protein [Chloroflexota bacterium]
MEQYGYMGKILYVDLTTRDTREEELPTALAMNFIGNFGMSAKLAYDLIKPGISPLSPENYMIVGASPLAGTGIPGATRCQLWTKYPLTNTIGSGGGPMGFSSRLKYAGYDELIITGRADKPVYLKVSDDGVNIYDASDLWGRDIYEVTDELWKRHGTMNSVMCMGQAGENLVKLSLAIIDKSGSIGRFGLGAVMGSKNLKAIVVGGRKKVKVKDPARLMKVIDGMMTKVMAWPIRDEFLDVSHIVWDIRGIATKGGLMKYASEKCDVDSVIERFGAEQYLSRAKKARLACPSCPTACRDVSQIRQGEYKGTTLVYHSFSYTAGMQLNFKEIEDSIKYHEVCQRYGLERIDTVMFTEMLLDLKRRGVITKDDLEGAEDENAKSLIKLAEKTAFRQGIGDAMADGLEGIMRRFGKKVEKYCHANKGGHPYPDPRSVGLVIQALDLIVNPMGGNQGKGGMVNPGKFDFKASVESFRKYADMIAAPQDAIDRIFETSGQLNVGRLLRHSQDYYATFCSLDMCMRVHFAQFYSMEILAALYSAVTGIEINVQTLKKVGERVWNVFKALNAREGFSRKDDKFPAFWFQPLKDGDKELLMMDMNKTRVLTSEDTEKMLDDYYDERGWEVERGIPTKTKLVELGLAEVAENLEKHGIVLK